MLAAPIWVDGTVEADIGRIVAGDHLARGVRRDGGLERRQILDALPAIVEGCARLGLKPAAGVGLRAATAAPAAFDRDRKFRKIRGRTRRLGGRLDRRVLEGMRGCSAHWFSIARNENKSRTIFVKTPLRDFGLDQAPHHIPVLSLADTGTDRTMFGLFCGGSK